MAASLFACNILRQHTSVALFAVAAALGCPCALAQTAAPAGGNMMRTFHLANVAQADEASHIATALRNILDEHDRIFLVFETNDIVVYAPADQIEMAGRLLADLDRPKKTYRLTYTLTESDAGKRVGVQHFSMNVVTGQRVTLKQGDKVPVATGSYNSGSVQTQFTYVDVGMNLDATLDQFGNGLRIRSKVEQSSAAESVSLSGAQEPIIRQSVLEGTSVIIPGKPVTLGGIDIVGSTRHTDVEVVAEPLP